MNKRKNKLKSKHLISSESEHRSILSIPILIGTLAAALVVAAIIAVCVINAEKSHEKTWVENCKEFGGTPIIDFRGVTHCVNAKVKEIKE